MNGQEKDDEIFQGAMTAEYWEYDSRLGRRWEMDPIIKTPESPYACFSDNPIFFSDPTGSNTVTPISNPEVGDKLEGLEYKKEGWSTYEVNVTPTSAETATKRDVTPKYSFPIHGAGTAINNNFNCHGTATNQDISENYYKDLLSRTDIEKGQLLPSHRQGYDQLYGLRTSDNGVLVNYTGYPATEMEISMHNQAEADIAIFSNIEGPGGGFRSFRAFKRFYGRAGDGQAWHHIVEQTESNVSRFGPHKIHHLDNLLKVEHGSASIHSRISGYYSSIQKFSEGKTVRAWLKDKSFEEQYHFGLEIIEMMTK